MIRKQNLLLIGGIVWAIAGFNVAKIGWQAYENNVDFLNVLLSIAIFTVFQQFVFGKMVRKHTCRILNYKEATQYFWKFFDRKAFIIMTVMITGGLGLRYSNICPDQFIAVFYTGLGTSLLLAGIIFLMYFGKEIRRNASNYGNDL